MTRRTIDTIFALALLLVGSLAIAQKPAPPPAAARPATPPERVERTLAQIIGDARPLRLQSDRDERIVSFPLSLRQRPESLTLRLRVTQSIALSPERSQLVITLNGAAIGQIGYEPGRQVVITELALPARLLKLGDYNQLGFVGIQHYRSNCESPEDAELWQEIDVGESRLVLEYRRQAVPANVGRLDDVFDAKLWGEPRVTIFPAGDLKSPALLRASAAVARAAAMRFRFQPTVFQKGDLVAGAGAAAGRFPGLPAEYAGDAVLVGTKDALAGSVGNEVLDGVRGPTLAVYPDDRDATRAVVLVAGTSAADVESAARLLLASRGTPLPQGESVNAQSIRPAAWGLYAAARGIGAGESRTFEQLGKAAMTTHGESIRVDLRLPPDLYARQRANVEIELHLAYAAGLSADSGLNVLLNDVFAAAVPLNNVRGERFLAYTLSLPLSVFKPGLNSLTFKPVMRSSVIGECAPRGGRFPLTLYADSVIRVPEASHFVRMPDLGRLRDDAFPFLAWPDGRSAALRLLDTDKASLESAWNLVGKLAQVRGAPAEQLEVGLAPVKDRDEIIVGPLEKLPADIAAAAPLNPLAPGRVELPSDLLAPSVPETKLSWFERLIGGQPARPKPILTDAPTTRVDTSGRPSGAYGLLMQMRSAGSDRSTVIVTAAAPYLAARVRTLVDYPVWDQMRGDVMLWYDDERSVYTQQVGPRWTVGEAGLSDRVEYWFSADPWRLVAIVAVAVGLLSAAVWIFVRRRLRARQAAGATTEF